MSGHSKWSKIKRQKGALDAKRGNLFTKLANAISMAAKEGGDDPDMNFKLRLAMDKAKQANMPKNNIDRAIKRGAGLLAGGQLEQLTYEGFGPEKIGVIIEVVTDNRNRASSNIKHILAKYDGALGSNGSVSWMFDYKGIVICESIKPLSEKQELELIEGGAEDWEIDESQLIIYTSIDNLQKLSKNLSTIGIEITSSELVYLPKKTIKINNPGKWQKFINTLEADDDVINYYSNGEQG